MNVVECCGKNCPDAAKCLICWRPRQDNFEPLECNEEPGLWRMWYVS